LETEPDWIQPHAGRIRKSGRPEAIRDRELTWEDARNRIEFSELLLEWAHQILHHPPEMGLGEN